MVRPPAIRGKSKPNSHNQQTSDLSRSLGLFTADTRNSAYANCVDAMDPTSSRARGDPAVGRTANRVIDIVVISANRFNANGAAVPTSPPAVSPAAADSSSPSHTLPHALHPDGLLLAQSGGALVRVPHRPDSATWRPQKRCGTEEGHQQLDQELKLRPQAVRLQEDGRRNPRLTRQIYSTDSGAEHQ